MARATYPVISRHNEFVYFIDSYQTEKDSDNVHKVVFEHFCPEAQMTVEIHVHWTNAWEYMMAKAPGYHSVTAVILNSGQRVHCDTRRCSSVGDEEYKARPKLLQSPIGIYAYGGTPMLWIRGGTEFAYSKRDQAARDKFRAEHYAEGFRNGGTLR